jgi:hypothetical protein
MMTRRPVFTGLLMLVASTGCGDPSSPDNRRSELDANRQKWRSNGVTSYSFTVARSCFCVFDGPVRVSVDHDSVVSVIRIESNTNAADLHFRPSIDSLFDFVEHAIGQQPAVLRVTYDPALGYPVTIVYDGRQAVADDEISFQVSDLVVAGTTDRSSAVVMESRRRLPRAVDPPRP